MKKAIALLLTLVCVLGLVGCNRKVDFADFSEYEEDFDNVAQFILSYHPQNNNEPRLILSIHDGQYIKRNGEPISDNSLMQPVWRIREKGFTYIEVEEDYMIFWEDETGYYGVLWSANPTEAIHRITKESRPYMKSRKLAEEWYEIGALDSI